MLKELLNTENLKDITVSRQCKPRYVDVIRKKFFRTKTERVQDGTYAIYIVKRDYIYSVLKVAVVCGNDVHAADIQVFDGMVSPEYWIQKNLSDQEKMATWREVKQLYEAEQQKKQEPEYWKEKIENAKICGQQRKDAFVNEILNMLRNVCFSNQNWSGRDIREQGHEGDVGAPAHLGCCIEAYGFLFSYYKEKNTLTVNQTVDGVKKLVLVINYIRDSQARDFIKISEKLQRLQSQRACAQYEKEEQEKTVREYKEKFDRLQLENQHKKEQYDSFLKNFGR